MELPETVPVYVIASEPTVPNRIVLPDSTPLMLSVDGGVESVIFPLTLDPDCTQTSLNVP